MIDSVNGVPTTQVAQLSALGHASVRATVRDSAAAPPRSFDGDGEIVVYDADQVAKIAASLTELEKLLITCLFNGQTLSDAAKQARVHYSTIVSYRKKLAAKLLDYMGADILRDIARIPQWRIGLDCERELLACRAASRSQKPFRDQHQSGTAPYPHALQYREIRA